MGNCLKGVSVCLIMVALVTGLAAKQAATQPRLERVILANVSQRSFSFLPTDIGLERGLFRAEGMDLKITVMRSTLSIAAVLSGDADFTSSIGGTTHAVVEGAPLKLLAATTVKPVHFLMAQPEIKSLKELKGKKIGIIAPGSLDDYAFLEVLASAGLTPREVSMVAIGQEPVKYAALKARAVDAVMNVSPFRIVGKREGFTTLLTSEQLGQIIPDMPSSGLGTAIAKINKDPGRVKRMVRGFVKSLRYVHEHRQEAIDFMVSKWDFSRDVATIEYEDSIKTLSRDGSVNDRGIQVNIDLSAKRVGPKQAVTVSKVVDFSFLREVQRELGLVR